MLTIEQKEIVKNTLLHPAFAFTDSSSQYFYTDEKLENLYLSLEALLLKINTLHLDKSIPERIEAIIAEGEYPFSSYYSSELDENVNVFPDERLPGRTAYGLLCTDDGSNCIGFSETCCILLNLCGYQATPMISKLLKSNQTACHYVTGVVDDNGNVRVIDPERKRSCSEPEKQWSLTAYQANIWYTIPDEEFCREKIGLNGLGPNFIEFISREGKMVAYPMEYIKANYPQVLNIDGRLDLKSISITPEIQMILDEAISSSVSYIYEQSMAMYHQQSAVRREA